MFRMPLTIIVLSLIGFSAKAETWRVVYNDFPPYSNTTNSGKPIGFAIDLLQIILKNIDVEVEYIRVDNPGEAIRMIRDGEADLHPHLSPTPERAAVISFTEAIKSIQVRAYRKKTTPAPKDTVTFKDNLIGVATGSLPDYIASSIADAEVIRMQSNNELFFALMNGEVDIALYADNAFEQIVRSLGLERDFAVVGEPLATQNVSIGVSLARPDIAKILNDEIKKTIDTSEYWAIHSAWFGSERPFWTPVNIAALIVTFLVFSALAALITYFHMRFKAKLISAKMAGISLKEKNTLIELLEARNKELELSTLDMQEMLSVVSHDLKSPLVSIAGFADMLKETLSKEADADNDDLSFSAIGRIQSNIEHMRRMIGNLLDLRKLDIGNANFVKFSVNEMLEQIRISLSHSLETEGVILKIPECGDIIGDRNLMQRAFQNLIENALRHAKTSDGVSLEVLKKDEEDWVMLGLRDNGPGVPNNRRTAIFELHQRLKKDADGLGIGLAIVRRVAQSHSGRAWVEDTPGGGSTFWMQIARDPLLAQKRHFLDVAA